MLGKRPRGYEETHPSDQNRACHKLAVRTEHNSFQTKIGAILKVYVSWGDGNYWLLQTLRQNEVDRFVDAIPGRVIKHLPMYTSPMFNIAMQLDTNWRIRYGQGANPNRLPMENAAQKCCKVHKTKYNPKLPKQNPSHPSGSEVRKLVHKTENSDVKTYCERMISCMFC